jgi:hypothetical protein
VILVGKRKIMANIIIKDEKYEVKNKKQLTYFMEDRLKLNLDDKVIPALQQKDKDILLIIDGHEGVGKSYLGFQIARYIDPTFNLNRVVFNAEDFRQAILKAKKGQVVIYDEAFTGLSARSSLSGVNKVLVSLMMQMRQKNLCVILILPTLFLLDKYAGIFRSKALIHVFEVKGTRGYFRVYNQKLKKLLYLFGSKTYNYAPKIGQGKKKLFTRFRGRFYGVFALGDEDIEKDYRERKMKALEDTEKDPMTSAQVKFRQQRDTCIYLLRKEMKMSYRKLAEYLTNYDFDISFAQIRSICARFGDKESKEELKWDKQGKKDEIEEESDDLDDKSDEINEESSENEDLE